MKKKFEKNFGVKEQGSYVTKSFFQKLPFSYLKALSKFFGGEIEKPFL